MLSKIFSVAHLALKTITVEVEVNAGRGTPSIYIVGLPSKAVQESEQRVKTALQNCNIQFPAKKVTINLAPADILKEGPLFDLPIAMGILTVFEHITIKKEDKTMFLGELSLDGRVRAVKGVLPAVLHAKQSGFLHVVIPKENESEVNIISGISIHPVSHIAELIDHYTTQSPLPSIMYKPFDSSYLNEGSIDFADVSGQNIAKRALEIAAAGLHNVLMNGSPGSGKSMLAKAMCSILPPLTEEEAIQITTIYSVTGLTSQGLITQRPFRSPHHTISHIGLIGGSSKLKPGEISLAHRGILFLDEFPEFSKMSIESLRQPLEDHFVHITRASGSTVYPAHFSLIAAANPCPCGYLYSKRKTCTCDDFHIQRYTKKLSGPILDRIDLHVQVQDVEAHLLLKKDTQKSESSREIRGRVMIARQKQLDRLKGTGFLFNGDLDSKTVKKYCHMTPEANTLLTTSFDQFHLSARSFFKVIKVAQTICDLGEEKEISAAHIAEALQFRSSDQVV